MFSFGSKEVFLGDDGTMADVVAICPELFNPKLARYLQINVLGKARFRRSSIRWNPSASEGSVVTVYSDRIEIRTLDGGIARLQDIAAWQREQIEFRNTRENLQWRQFQLVKKIVGSAAWSTETARVAAAFESTSREGVFSDIWYVTPSRGDEVWNPCTSDGSDLVEDSSEALDYYPLSTMGKIGLRGEQYWNQKLVLQGHRYQRDRVPDIAYFAQVKLPTMNFPEGSYTPRIISVDPRKRRLIPFDEWSR